MDNAIYFVAALPIYVASVYALMHVLTKHEKKHHVRHIFIIAGSAVLSWVVSVYAKDIIAHPRPDLSSALFIPSDPYSFPSGHAAFMFGLAWSMYSFDKHAGKILFILATVTGIARVLAGVHYWYDIVGGFMLAYFIAYVIHFASRKILA
ncbi:MAG: phosphatase PAP2 family protein [Candidatus Paceibacterota bacterium]